MLAVAAVLGMAVAARGELKTGDPFPSFASASADGALPATAGHVTIVDFWASWCAPCKASFPFYARLQADYAGRGVIVIAVSVDEKRAAYEAFVKKHQPPFVTLLDRDRQLVRNVGPPAMPTSYVLGRDGKVRFIHVGFHGAETEKEMRAQLESLLGEKP
ncbi:MAG: Redoxin domain protein [Verrucomicrobia bacterium]|nr:Redoxin domain protein [Verrucomicrobiota bacterium]